MPGTTIVASLIIAVLWASMGVCQRTMPSGDNASQLQWNSHQMNQPAAPQYNLSQDRLDDIRRLYDQALEESRNPSRPTGEKDAATHHTGFQE